MAKYFDKEWALFQSGDRTQLTQLSAVWNDIENPDGTINSNYGYLTQHLADCGDATFAPELRTPWQCAHDELLLCADSNRAVMLFLRPRHFYRQNLDMPCTTHVQFLIRNDRLHLHANNAFQRHCVWHTLQSAPLCTYAA